MAESLLDALSLWCAGFRHVTAAYGTEGFTAELFAAFERHRVKRVLFAFDRDDAGDRAAKKVAAKLMAGGIECFRIEFPRDADVNDVARDAISPTEVLGRYIRKAAWMGAGPGPGERRHAGPIERPPESTAEPEPSSFAAEPPNAGRAGRARGGVAAPTAGLHSPEVTGVGEATFRLGDRRWRVRGLDKVSSFDLLCLNVLVSRPDERHGQVFHVDTLDLYSARTRAVFTKAATEEVGLSEDVVKRDVARVLLACEGLADEAVTAAQAPAEATVELSEQDRAAALGLLRSPDLVKRVVADFARAGVVGETTNCLVGYLAAVSRTLNTPLAVIVQSTSAAGKSALMEAVLAMVPGEERIKFSAMTGQSLFYMGEADLAHKVLAVAEEEGAERAAYALKLLQSEGELSIASTGKDNASGRLVTHTYRVVGPVAIMLTTTAIDVDDELLNRCLDAQRLLEPVAVVNPFATQLSFADAGTRTRRDHVKYLSLIRSVAVLHQQGTRLHLHHICTTSEGKVRLPAVSSGQPESRRDL